MSDVSRLFQIVSTLRNKQNGCKWDSIQTSKSLAPYTIEEAYEVVDAIDRSDKEALKEELGDLLLHIVFHSQIAEDEDLFSFNDVVEHISNKMINRHPHVFCNRKNIEEEEIINLWHKIKKEERRRKYQDKKGNYFDKIYRSIPKNLPELKRSQKIQHRTDESIDFLYDKMKDIIEDIWNEIKELEEEVRLGNKERIKHELGDVIFAMCRIANKFRLDAEDALRHSNNEFERRFRFIGEELKKLNIKPQNAGKDLLEKLWKEAKS